MLMEAMEHGGRSGEPLSVIALDLDRFKQVNDVLGYALGDRLLQAVVARIASHLRAQREVVARLGGNEFAVLLPGADEASARDTAQRITRAFESPLVFDDQMVDLSAGIGIACWPGPAHDADTLLGHAEIAMYAAKRRLHGAQIYDPSMESSSAEALSLLSELRRAVEAGELRLFLQPKLRLDGQGGSGAEALVRWQHPVRGLVPPMQFIPFAEQTGFVRQLTLWIFEQAARYLARPQVQGLGLRISVNLSTRDLMDTDLSTRLGTLMARHGVEPGSFCLEITESAIMDDPGRAEAMLNRLSAQGFKLSIDDFGTGYSSLAYLKRLPVDELKIDKSFVMGMAADAGDAQIVRSTIDLAHNLGLSVVAEGRGIRRDPGAAARAALRRSPGLPHRPADARGRLPRLARGRRRCRRAKIAPCPIPLPAAACRSRPAARAPASPIPRRPGRPGRPAPGPRAASPCAPRRPVQPLHAPLPPAGRLVRPRALAPVPRALPHPWARPPGAPR